MITPEPNTKGLEPHMYLQRPSSGKSQHVSALLSHTLRQLFSSREGISPEVVKNLKVSKNSTDKYHQQYVASLEKVFEEKERRYAEAAMLECHIMEAKAQAMSVEEQELERQAMQCKQHRDARVPLARSYFRTYIDGALLKQYGLLSPKDYTPENLSPVPPPKGDKCPYYTRNTAASQQDVFQFEESSLTVHANEGLPTHLPDDLKTSRPVPHRVGLPAHDLWKQCINLNQKLADKHDLHLLEAKVNYLRNPRHIPPADIPGALSLIKPTKLQKLGENSSNEPVMVFLATPSVVKFEDYTVGTVYEITLELKNVTAVLRPCRILPPSTAHFSVGLGQFPGEHGLVAPGMSCLYAVRFIPDCLKNFDDEITVCTQASLQKISLQGRRQHPILTLPSVIDIGYCLVGSFHVVQILFTNTGGAGQFCVLPKSAWPTSNMKSVVMSNTVTIDPFMVRPSTFKLNVHTSGIIEVAFSPTHVKRMSQEITIIADNCHIKHFTLTGEAQQAEVKLEDVEGDEAIIIPGDLFDVLVPHRIKFQELHPYIYLEKTLKIRNLTNVELPFYWLTCKPYLQTPGQECLTYERIPYPKSGFSVSPVYGIIPPAEVMQFKAVFAPQKEGSYHAVIQMFLEQIPLSFQCSEESLQSDGDFETPLKNETLSKTSNKYQEVVALEIELKGKCIPFNVQLSPYAIFVPDSLLVGMTIRKNVSIMNYSNTPISFYWDFYTEDYILEVDPVTAVLNPKMAIDLQVCITGAKPGKIKHSLMCHVLHLKDPLILYVEADIKGPEVIIEEPEINFELVRLGTSVEKTITLCNLAQISDNFSILDHPISSEMDTGEICITPSKGQLKPLERFKVLIKFTPTKVQTMTRLLQVQVENGNNLIIAAHGEVQSPVACLESCSLLMEDVFIGVPSHHVVVLQNQTFLSTTFEWGQAQGDQASVCSIHFDQQCGVLHGKENKSLAFDFVAHEQVKISEVLLPCQVHGMYQPLWLALSCDVKGLSVAYMVSDSSDPGEGDEFRLTGKDVCIDFGDHVVLGSSLKLYVHIHNLSGLEAPYHVSMSNFVARLPSPPSASSLGMQNKSQNRPVKHLSDFADPLNSKLVKANANFMAAILRDEYGTAFLAQPLEGILKPFSTAVIEITSFNDMWGSYNDRFLCQVGDLELTEIPIKMTVIGCPLNFQFAASGTTPILRIGTHVAGAKSVTRKLRINNTSCSDIRVDWETYNVDKANTQLLDLLVVYGNPFPLQDSEGNEILPTLDDYSSSGSSNFDETNIIRTICRIHDGMRALNPFHITPGQLVIPKKDHAFVEAHFTPPSAQNFLTVIDYISFGLGFLSLDTKKQDRKLAMNINRAQGYDMMPIKIDMVAKIKPALLVVEYDQDGGLSYQAAASDLFQKDQKIALEYIKVCTMKLSNLTEAVMTFQLLLKDPFMFIHFDPYPNSVAVQPCMETCFITVKHQGHLMVKVAFLVTFDLLKYKKQTVACEDVQKIVVNGDHRLLFRQDLKIKFSNDTVQLIPIQAILSFPEIELSTSKVNFKTCLVGQRRSKQITIENKTLSKCMWRVSVVFKNCEDSTLEIEPSSGFLDGHVTNLSQNKACITIYFTARNTKQFKAHIMIEGSLQENPQIVQINGCGSFDGCYEAVVNI